MNRQETFWHGKGGNEYHLRNDEVSRVKQWQKIIKEGDLYIKSAIEFGCGKGDNLHALRTIGVNRLTGIEVNTTAAAIAKARTSSLIINESVESAVSQRGAGFIHEHDLVISRGFLIHVPECQLESTLLLLGCAKKYVVMIEYNDFKRREVKYHDEEEMLWADAFAGKFLTLQADDGNTWSVKRLPLDLIDGTTTHIFTREGVTA